MARAYNQSELYDIFKRAVELCQKLNRIPTPKEFKTNRISYDILYSICKKNNTTIRKYFNQFGYDMLTSERKVKTTYNQRVRASSLTKDDVSNIIMTMQNKLERPLMYDDFRCPKESEVGITLIKKYWGTLNKMKQDLNLEIVQDDMLAKVKTKDEMIDDMEKLIDELGRLPVSHEINENKNMSNCSTYARYFGGINTVFKLLGYKPNKENISLSLTNEKIIELYKKFIDENGYVPTFDYAEHIDYLPCPTTVLRRFNCKWNDFILMMGYTPNECMVSSKPIFAKDGTKCLSFAESIIHNYLIDLQKIKNFNLEKEVLYRDFVHQVLIEKSGFKRCDWIITYNNKIYIVEYFGMMGIEGYNRNHEEKINIIKSSNLYDNFIGIYPKDLNKLDDIFSFLNNT